ncbi:DALR anticodon-binding domain-containing protein [Streptomyces sp. MI02-2A]|nr:MULTISPECIES: arginine--tRNA ligase [unclassified Streptomyces]MDX3263471.1 DALR anticodon-binding domain-containing protein [Streptomyces sp. MI02-2A]REE63421.1 arginyl-tRNA synthetase [Streptomyces sp. 3212.3]
MTPVELSRTVLCAVRRAVDDGELSVAVPARAVVTPPGPGGRGDYATNIALQLARPAGRPARQVAEILRSHLRDTTGVADVEITGPGFLNIHLEGSGATASLVREILQGGGGYASGRQGILPTGINSGPAVDSSRDIDSNRDENSTDVGGSTDADPDTDADGHTDVDREADVDSGADVDRDADPAPDTVTATRPTIPPYGHTPTLQGRVIPLRVPYEVRAEVVADSLVRIIATQGGRAEVDHVRPGERVDLRPVPAPEDPAPLGPDAARWALLYPAPHDRPRITADHLLQRESNPLFRVRYAHARARALGRNAVRLGFDAVPGDLADVTAADPLVRALAEYPNALTQAAAHRAPDRLARHLVAVADALLAFQHTVLPLGDEKPSAAHRARLALAVAAGTVLAGGLSLLGISAPDYL